MRGQGVHQQVLVAVLVGSKWALAGSGVQALVHSLKQAWLPRLPKEAITRRTSPTTLRSRSGDLLMLKVTILHKVVHSRNGLYGAEYLQAWDPLPPRKSAFDVIAKTCLRLNLPWSVVAKCVASERLIGS